MTAVKYLIESKVGQPAEIILLKARDPKGFDLLKQWAEEEMKHLGVEITRI